MKKYFTFFILIFGFLFPLIQIHAVTGFVPGQIWYSPETFSEGETVKIHTVVWNGNDSDLQAKVEFYDKNVILGSRDITVLPDQIKEINITWKVTSGDHTISAKILSSSVTNNGKKEKVTLDNIKTEESKIFIPVTITKGDGEVATSSDVLKNEIDKASSKIGDIVPESIASPVSEVFNKVDDFREDSSSKISLSKDKTKEEIKVFDNSINKDDKKEAISATDKPIAYIKLFLLSVIGFIFETKILFYGLLVFIIFLILRAIYRKIKR